MRFVVRECHGFPIDPTAVNQRSTRTFEPVGYVVLDSAVCYRNYGEFWPEQPNRGLTARGAIARAWALAETRAREMNEACHE